MTTDAEIIAKLDKPGAGVPFFDGLLMRWYVGPVLSKKASWEENRKAFDKTTQALLKLVDGLDEKQLATRVLVPPQRGLEDSSRYWSAAMLLEHLIIVGKKTKAGIVALSQGIVPDVKVDTGKVKPLGEANPKDIMDAYRAFATTVMDELDREVKDKDSKASLKHPWMGPMTCRQWHWLLPTHQAIHLKQLREIVKGLGARQ
jgi:hypothetical protein